MSSCICRRTLGLCYTADSMCPQCENPRTINCVCNRTLKASYCIDNICDNCNGYYHNCWNVKNQVIRDDKLICYICNRVYT